MAHAAHVAELARELSLSLGCSDPSQIWNGIKNRPSITANQFLVRDRLNGLVEKFTVKGRDDLADALQSRLDCLPTACAWLPEALLLLLELSDKPVEKSRPCDLKQPVDAPVSELAWNEIISDDPLTEKGLWDDIERCSHSSGEIINDFLSTTSAETIPDDEDVYDVAKVYIIQPKPGLLQNVSLQGTSELSLIRETINMMRGLPSNVYRVDEATLTITPVPVRIPTAASSTSFGLLSTAAETSSKIALLRKWCRVESEIPHVQAVQSAAEAQLYAFSQSLGRVEKRFTTSLEGRVISLNDIIVEIRSLARGIVHLARTLCKYHPAAQGCGVLDTLYEEVAVLRTAGDEVAFEALYCVFYEGMKCFLLRVHRWICMGEASGDDVDMPMFLKPFSQRIIELSRERAFVHLLSREEPEDEETTQASLPTYSTSLHDLTTDSFLPFREYLSDIISTWLNFIPRREASLHSLLQPYLTSLPSVFFAANGEAYSAFADAAFRILTKNDPGAEFILSEIAEGTLAAEGGGVSISFLPPSKEVSQAHHPEVRPGNRFPPGSMLSRLENLTLTFHPNSRAVEILLGSEAIPSSEATLPSSFARSFTTLLRLTYLTSHLPRHPALFTLSTLLSILSSYFSQTPIELHSTLLATLPPGFDGIKASWGRFRRNLDVAMLLAPELSVLRGAVEGVMCMAEKVGSCYGDASGRDAFQGRDVSRERRRLASLDEEVRFLVVGLESIARAAGKDGREGYAALERLGEKLRGVFL
ncbi:hypothetical protein K470DRAFT_295453 [Piedraia hortae CBS 480.64]|uniref:Uncharacterized protein n=1 Tax=Piedraia hortae CBS 480.64 TaxID=1314780 RepID=A0A6A7BYX6_9PEZI|nr:hypothetical protein K470DRAFT_295453 [Piedraia hortae CBS 480.64]